MGSGHVTVNCGEEGGHSTGTHRGGGVAQAAASIHTEEPQTQRHAHTETQTNKHGDTPT